MAFFFFFQRLENISTIRQAFSNIFLNKILYDGYFDMSRYIYARSSREEMIYRLAADRSKYIKLFQTDYPDKDLAYEKWCELFPGNDSYSDCEQLTVTEAEAIVYWVYMTMRGPDERTRFTYDLFANIKDLHQIERHIQHRDGVFYNSEKVELEIVSSISQFNSTIAKLKREDSLLFFRGHADANYSLQPSVFRNENWKNNEYAMYNELLINCPDDFEKCHSHLEKLVEMQHYGLPTRLLDITLNPLVALYFACASKSYCYGEIVPISAKKGQVKYPQSDTASVLASLAALDRNTQLELYQWAMDPGIDKAEFNIRAVKLLHEIRLEKPAFRADIVKEDLIGNIIVLAAKNNRRIVKQDGAFILCGLSDDPGSLNKFRAKSKGKTNVVLVTQKEKILKQLSAFSIDRATLFPEIDCVAEHIKNIYFH